MTEDCQGTITMTHDQMRSMLKSKAPSLGWIATVVGLVLAIAGGVAGATAFITSNSEKESRAAAEAVKAPIYEKLAMLDAATSQSLEAMRVSTSREVSGILDAVKANQDAMRQSLDRISRDVEAIAKDQKDIVSKLHTLEVRQAVLDEELTNASDLRGRTP